MEIQILGQGYESESKNAIGKVLIEFLKSTDYYTLTVISAFTRYGAVTGFSTHIEGAKSHLNPITFITGVSLGATSKQALEALLSLNIDTYVFGVDGPVFHPKIYLFEGNEKSELIIGSSNFTSTGLFSNIETSILVSINNKNAEDVLVIENLKEYFKGIFDRTDPNLKRLDQQLIDELYRQGYTPDEVRSSFRKKKSIKGQENLPEDLLSRIFPKREIAKIPSEFRNSILTDDEGIELDSIEDQIDSDSEDEGWDIDDPSDLFPEEEESEEDTKNDEQDIDIENNARPIATKRGNTRPEETTVSNLNNRTIVWTRNKLPSSSVQGGTGATNPTGGLRLVQDGFKVKGIGIDHTNYFRYSVFKDYEWEMTRSSPYVEKAIVPFEIIVYDINLGTHNLEIRHKPSGEAGQRNYTTSISWGEIGPKIKSLNLVNRRLDLYAPLDTGNPFLIKIT